MSVKKAVTGVVVLLAGAIFTPAQGQVPMYFANYLYLSPYIYVSLGSTLLGGSNTVTIGVPEMDVGNGNDWTVALWGNLGAGDSSATLEANGNLATATLENGVDDLNRHTNVFSAPAMKQPRTGDRCRDSEPLIAARAGPSLPGRAGVLTEPFVRLDLGTARIKSATEAILTGMRFCLLRDYRA